MSNKASKIIKQKNLKKVGRPMIQNKERKYKCGCGKQYLSTTNLDYHYKKEHNGIPPKNSYFKKPKGRRTLRRNYKCGCGKYFSYRRGLNTHLKRKHS